MEQPAQRSPAREGLDLVQAFVNSADLEEGTDQLGDAISAERWLRDHWSGPLPSFHDTDRARLVETREALRDVLSMHSGHDNDARASARLRDLLAGVVLRPVVDADGARLEPAGDGVDGFLGAVSARIAEATVAGTWERLKVCRDDVCRWAFYDHSKNARGTWCSMRVCGNRAKARAYRERQKVTATA